ncbi:hypothetical protein RJT34_23619 [Clitoria ternatea]|uniref:S-protein homolog n=1 Tax=Clitoria ternatea TaxID=43366 RepID=A0AAN9IGR0_CLITE
MSEFGSCVLILWLLMLPSSTMNGAMGFKILVSVLNDLQGNKDLSIHCKSKSNDLGVEVLHHGEAFQWFIWNPNGETLYFCSFEWEGAFKSFDIYVGTRDSCSYCRWYVKETGPCFHFPSASEKCFPWM